MFFVVKQTGTKVPMKAISQTGTASARFRRLWKHLWAFYILHEFPLVTSKPVPVSHMSKDDEGDQKTDYGDQAEGAEVRIKEEQFDE